MTGVGGDMFALIWSAKEKKLVALNASGRAGSLMTREELVKRGRTRIPRGIETVTVPGALAGWDALLKKYGTITLAQVLEPAIGYAENGFVVTPVISGDWAGQRAILLRDEGAKATFLPNGEPPKAGDYFRNPDYAATLRQIAKEGPSTLYGGALGQKLVARIQQLGGFLTLDDLKKNQPTWVTPISTMFKGYRVWELPPNNQGIATLEMLRILEPYDLKAMGLNSATYLHHLIEAKKLAYADLTRYVGDADHLTHSAEPHAVGRVHRRASQSHRFEEGAGAGGAGSGAHGERDDLSLRRRQRRQHGVVHQQPVRRIRFGHRRSGHRVRAARSRLGIHDGARSAEHGGAGQASVSHAHSGIRHEAGSRRRGGRNAATNRT